MTVPTFVKFGFDVEAWSDHPRLIQQDHSSAVVEIAGPDALRDAIRTPLVADGCWTREFDTEIYCFTADCVPMLLCGSQLGDPVAALHVGWRGLLAGVVENAIDSLDVPKERLHVVIGPAAKGCCYEVKSDFVRAFQSRGVELGGYLFHRQSRLFFDSTAFIIAHKLRSLLPDNIHLENSRCTVCAPEILPSKRRGTNVRRHIRAWIRKSDQP